ncbi:MAG TPA: hypothetical protein VIO94_13600 [Phenylobacterium sp.]
MPITSFIEEDEREHGLGRGHTSHGNGKGLGHEKHAAAAMEDGEYEINVSGVNHVNPTGVSQTSAPTVLADGSTINTEVREGSITIGTIEGQDGLHLTTDSNNGRLRLNTVFDEDQQVTLGELDQLSFQYYVASSSRTDVIPVIRLIVDGDGNLATTADRGELVFEYAYQGLGPVTEDEWQTADLAGDDWVAWQRSNGQNWDQISNMTTLSDWADANGSTPVGGVNFNEDSVVLGYSIAYGSGNGTGDMYIDKVNVNGVTTDFVAA